MAAITEYLVKRSGLPVSILRKTLFMLSGDDAVWHVMRVSVRAASTRWWWVRDIFSVKSDSATSTPSKKMDMEARFSLAS
eukprot:scaffold79527_cov29-Attheya_sp.AAC.1